MASLPVLKRLPESDSKDINQVSNIVLLVVKLIKRFRRMASRGNHVSLILILVPAPIPNPAVGIRIRIRIEFKIRIKCKVEIKITLGKLSSRILVPAIGVRIGPNLKSVHPNSQLCIKGSLSSPLTLSATLVNFRIRRGQIEN